MVTKTAQQCECGHAVETHNRKGHCRGTTTEGLFGTVFPCACCKVRLAPPPLHYKETNYGFEYGAAKISRLFSDAKKGWVALGLNTPKNEKAGKQGYQLYVTKTGKVRIYTPDGMAKPETIDHHDAEEN